MARNDGFKVEKRPSRIGRTPHVHGEMPACTEDADVGGVQIVEHFHIRHHVGITRNIDRVPGAFDHKAAFSADKARSLGTGHAGGMHRVYHGDGNSVQIDSSAFVKAFGLNALCVVPKTHQIVLAKDRDVQTARER